MLRFAIKAFRIICAPLCAGILAALIAGSVAGAQEPPDGVDRAVQWEGADYTSFAGFVKALERQRYVALIFKRISADLERGQAAAIRPLMERYLEGRHASIAGTRLSGDARVALHKTVNDDVRAGLATLAKSSALLVPENLRQQTMAIARRITDSILDPSARPAGETPFHGIDRDGDEKPNAKKKTRAENTGLFRDIVDMVKQSHLQFLVGGDALTAKARVAAEILKVAAADHLLVDVATAQAFADQLIKDDVLHPDERHFFLDELEAAAGLKPKKRAEEESDRSALPREHVREAKPDAPETSEEDRSELLRDHEDTTDQPLVESKATVEADHQKTAEHDDAGVVSSMTELDAANPHKVPPPPRHVPEPTRPTTADKADFLITAELGGGLGIPLHKGDLQPVGQKIDLNPGFSTRAALGAVWLNALGAAHVSLSLVGVLGETTPDRLLGVAGPGGLDTTGTRSYFGVLPFLALEWPVASGINLRIGAGLGIAHQRLKVVDAGARIVSARGTSVLAQLGAGARVKVSECADAGLDFYATYLDGVKGSGIGGAPVSLRSTWDLAAVASLRFTINSEADRTGCGLFHP